MMKDTHNSSFEDEKLINEDVSKIEDTDVYTSMEKGKTVEQEDVGETQEIDETFSSRQRWQIILAIFISFFIFGIILFPYQAILHYSFAKLTENLPLSYHKIELNFFENSFIENLRFQPSKQLSVQVKKFDLGIPLFNFVRSHINGRSVFFDLYVSSKNISFLSKKTDFLFDLKHFKLPVKDWKGKINVKGENIVDLQVAQFASLGLDLSKIDIQKFDFKLNFGQNKLKLNNSQIISNYFTISLNGFIDLKNNFSGSRLNGELCIAPVADLEKKDASLLSIYLIAGGQSDGELCLQVKGTLGSPEFIRKQSQSELDTSAPSNAFFIEKIKPLFIGVLEENIS